MTSSALSRPQEAGTVVRWATDVVAGLVCGFIAIVASIGNGSLLFSHGLPEYVPVSIGLALFSSVVLATVSALISSGKTTVAVTQEVPVVALSSVLVAVASALPAGADPHARFATIMVAVGLGTASIGLAALILGWLRLGSIVRFIPYPVIGGFLAGTGYLVATGGLGLILGHSINLDLFTHLPDTLALERLGAGAVFVAVVAVFQTRATGPLVLPGLILAALVVFNAAGFALGATPEALRAAGWVIHLPQSGRLWPAISPGDFSAVDWRAILIGALGVPTMIVVSIIAFLMNATGIELATRRDFDIDRELRTVGVMNLVAGAGGGAPGFHTFSLSLLATRLSGSSRLVGLIVAALCAAALFFGGHLLDAMPTFILGGLLTWIGATQLYEWLVRSYKRLRLTEYFVIILIFVIIIGVSFAVGILVGIIAAIVLFAVEYSRIDIVRHEMTGVDYQSGADSSEKRSELLQLHGGAILIIRLQGYLFFGTADRLRRRVQNRMTGHLPGHAGHHHHAQRRPRFVVVDFRRVAGLDSSAVVSFIRLAQMAEREGYTVVLTALSPAAETALARGGFSHTAYPSVRLDADIERGLKWCEDALIADISPETSGAHPRMLGDIIADVMADSGMTGTIVAACQRIEAKAGDILIRQNEPSNDILFIEAGHAAVEIPSEGGKGTIRLATVGPGAIVGEMAFYLGEKRSASIVAEEPMVVWAFTRAAMERLQAEEPAAALRFHSGMAAMLAKRLTRTNRIVRFLAD
jgi:SulP family sulfate permease